MVAGLRRAWPGSAALWAVAAGISGTVGLGALYRGMAVGAIGVVAPLSSASAVIPVGVGIATGERPSGLQLGGVAFALVGVVLASRERIEGRVRIAAGVELALLAAAGFGLYFVLIDHAADGRCDLGGDDLPRDRVGRGRRSGARARAAGGRRRGCCRCSRSSAASTWARTCCSRSRSGTG